MGKVRSVPAAGKVGWAGAELKVSQTELKAKIDGLKRKQKEVLKAQKTVEANKLFLKKCKQQKKFMKKSMKKTMKKGLRRTGMKRTGMKRPGRKSPARTAMRKGPGEVAEDHQPKSPKAQGRKSMKKAVAEDGDDLTPPLSPMSKAPTPKNNSPKNNPLSPRQQKPPVPN